MTEMCWSSVWLWIFVVFVFKMHVNICQGIVTNERKSGLRSRKTKMFHMANKGREKPSMIHTLQNWAVLDINDIDIKKLLLKLRKTENTIRSNHKLSSSYLIFVFTSMERLLDRDDKYLLGTLIFESMLRAFNTDILSKKRKRVKREATHLRSWGEFKNNLFKSYQYGFPSGTGRNAVIPAEFIEHPVLSQMLNFGKVLRVCNEKANPGCGWGYMVRLRGLPFDFPRDLETLVRTN